MGSDPVIPPLNLPFPSRLNPHTGDLARHLDQWATEWAALPPSALPAWRAARFERLVGRMYPTARPPLLGLTGEAVLWLFLYDDHLDPGCPGDDTHYAEQALLQVRRILDGRCATPPDDPLTACVWWLRHRLLPLIGTDRWAYVSRELDGFADAMRNEVAIRSQGRTPEPEEYLAARHRTSGWHILTAFAELHAGATFPDSLRSSTTHRALVATAGDVACTINDLLSLRKEAAAGERHNLVLAIGHRDKCDLPAAVGITHRWLRTRVDDYLRARADLLSQFGGFTDPGALARYASGIEALMTGSLSWSHETGRYGHADNTVPAEGA
ncbi:hypothetical protein ACFVXC_30400 [Streptomyces sp. NPDC058257]|uniref:terpene synthase family protein n=1 Tax=Streptomyces sp. NPDC058257 TaxID=3346409 RepID=UPI0036F0D7E0